MALGDIDEKQVVADEVVTKHQVPRENTLGYKFCVTTSCHGLSNVAEARRTWVRWFWTLAVLMALVLLLQQAVAISMQHAASEAVTMSYVNRSHAVEFPAITICNYNRFRKDKIDKVAKKLDLQADALWKYLSYALMETTGPLKVGLGTDDKLLIWEVHSNLSRLLPEWERVDVLGLLEEVSYSLEDLIPMESCHWSGFKAGTCRAAMFRSQLTMLGRCWSFNFAGSYDANLVQYVPGNGAGLNMLINVGHHQNVEQVLSGGHTQSGVRVLVHSPTKYPTIDTETVAVPPGVYAYLTLQATRDLRVGPPWGSCGETALSYFPIYTEDACYTEDLIKHIKSICGCVPIFLIDPAKEREIGCSPIDVYSCVNTALETYFSSGVIGRANCPVDCDSMKYEGRISHATNPNLLGAIGEMASQRYGNDVTSDFIRENILQLEIYFQQLKVNVVEQKPGKSFESFLADLGGQMGLFMGASLITICEFMEYLIVKCSIILRYYKTKGRMRRERRRAAAADVAGMEMSSNGGNGDNGLQERRSDESGEDGGFGQGDAPIPREDPSNPVAKATFL